MFCCKSIQHIREIHSNETIGKQRAVEIALENLEYENKNLDYEITNICVMSAMDDGAGFYDVRTEVSSATFYNVPSSYLVTITKHNYIPYLKDANVTYIQNELIYAYRYVSAQSIYAGENVTILKSQGPVKIKDGAHVVFDAINDVYIEEGFEVELGGRFEVK